jgi:hypothetical protein
MTTARTTIPGAVDAVVAWTAIVAEFVAGVVVVSRRAATT